MLHNIFYINQVNLHQNYTNELRNNQYKEENRLISLSESKLVTQQWIVESSVDLIGKMYYSFYNNKKCHNLHKCQGLLNA